MKRNNETRGRRSRRAMLLTGVGAAALGLGIATPALASAGAPAYSHPSGPPIELISVTPGPGTTAGSGGVFNVDLAAQARNGVGNWDLSAADGYKPGIANPAPGLGHPDPTAPGFVLLLSTTPAADGGPDANVMGAFQLTDVANTRNLNQVIADWEVGKPDVFGAPGTKVTLTAFVVAGTAPGIVTGSVHPISNVIRETFRIG